jgi:hypothetical protein
MDNLQKFNVTFGEFIEDLVKVIPDDAELRVYEMLLRNCLKSDPHYVLDVFHTCVTVPYADEIMNRNEDFFLRQKYDSITQEDSQALDVVDRIKAYWKELNDANKGVVWKYFRILVLLDKKIHQ